MAKIRLGINMGFAVNRFPEPEVWGRIVGEKLGLKYIQFVPDLLNPFYPPKVINRQIRLIKGVTTGYGIKVDTTFTSLLFRVNHLLHPDRQIRLVWMDWFKRYFDIAAQLGARGAGSHFGAMSVTDLNNPGKREYIISEGVGEWQKLSRYGKSAGLEFLMFEPMSIPREMAHTIRDTHVLLKRVNKDVAIPINLCLDVDHGDLESKNPDDTDPYVWIREFGKVSPVIHIKQSLKDKSGHWPFIKKHNRRGIIKPSKVISAIEMSKATDVVLAFEFSHRERYPTEYNVLQDLKESVDYWREYIKED
jgi:sugar phosphate isomerase/epimerase